MFNLQGSEIVIVLLLALVVLGPEKLPDAMRRLGNFYAELKKMSSGFQSEFRAAIDEPMREVRDTANVLRDSADLTSLRNGEREEKPKSAEMAPIDDPEDVPAEAVSDFDRPGDHRASAEPGLAADSKPAPFSGRSSAAPRGESSAGGVDADDLSSGGEIAADGGTDAAIRVAEGSVDSEPAPFSGQSSAAPRLAASDAAESHDESRRDAAELGGAPGDGTDVEPADADQASDVDDATGHAR